MGQRFLMDSNVLIDFIAQTLSHSGFHYVQNVIDSNFIIPAIVKIEVLGFNGSRPQQMLKMQKFVSLATILPLDDHVIEETINFAEITQRLR